MEISFPLFFHQLLCTQNAHPSMSFTPLNPIPSFSRGLRYFLFSLDFACNYKTLYHNSVYNQSCYLKINFIVWAYKQECIKHTHSYIHSNEIWSIWWKVIYVQVTIHGLQNQEKFCPQMRMLCATPIDVWLRDLSGSLAQQRNVQKRNQILPSVEYRAVFVKHHQPHL